MPASKARIKANDKYNKKTYNQLNLKIKKDVYSEIDNYCTTNNISKAQLITNSVKYCIENDIDILNYVPVEDITDNDSEAAENMEV